jgi:hypothetical protein
MQHFALYYTMTGVKIYSLVNHNLDGTGYPGIYFPTLPVLWQDTLIKKMWNYTTEKSYAIYTGN